MQYNSDDSIVLKIKSLTKSCKVPTRGDPFAAGYDLYASMAITIPKWSRRLVHTGIAMEIPPNYYGRIAPRSSCSMKGYDIGAGVIDSSYRGEIKICFVNSTDEDCDINVGDKIAQIIITPHITPTVLVTDTLEDSERGENGFGSTGT